MATRKVVTRSGSHIRGYFPSLKMGRMIAWESLLERDAIIHFELSPGVIAYREQPSIEIYYEGTVPRKYFPDFEITLRNEETVHIEVKPTRTLDKPSIKTRYQRIAAQYEQQARNFWILTDHQLRREPRLANLKTLAYHKRDLADKRALLESIQRMAKNGAMSISAATRLCGNEKLVFQLLAAGLLVCDLDSPLTDEVLISVDTMGGANDSLLF